MKQAPRAWNEKIDAFLWRKGFYRSVVDPNLYIYRERGLTTTIVLYVDDLIVTGDNGKHVRKTKDALSSEFEMTNMGLLHFFLGLEIWQSESGIFITQQCYV